MLLESIIRISNLFYLGPPCGIDHFRRNQALLRLNIDREIENFSRKNVIMVSFLSWNSVVQLSKWRCPLNRHEQLRFAPAQWRVFLPLYIFLVIQFVAFLRNSWTLTGEVQVHSVLTPLPSGYIAKVDTPIER